MLKENPGMTTTFFSILGPYRGMICYHLGLKISEPASACGIRVGSKTQHREEGKSLIFGDTYDHKTWSHTGGDRAVLFVDSIARCGCRRRF